MIVKMEIDLERGFAPWKEMFTDNEYKLNEHGGKLVFAGDEELTKIRAASGAKLETAIATIMSSDSFTKT